MLSSLTWKCIHSVYIPVYSPIGLVLLLDFLIIPLTSPYLTLRTTCFNSFVTFIIHLTIYRASLPYLLVEILISTAFFPYSPLILCDCFVFFSWKLEVFSALPSITMTVLCSVIFWSVPLLINVYCVFPLFLLEYLFIFGWYQVWVVTHGSRAQGLIVVVLGLSCPGHEGF